MILRMRSALVTPVLRHLMTVTCVLLCGVSTACERGSDASVEAGRDLYRQNGCVSCHGREGHGDGQVGGTLEIRPRDLRDAAAYKQGTDVDSIADTIANGVSGGAAGARQTGQVYHHTQVMPRFNHLSDAERRSIALYVISLQRPEGATRNQP